MIPRRFRRGGLALAVLLGLFFAPALPPELVRLDTHLSLQLVDRNGRLLREVLSSQAGVAHWIPLDEVDPALVEATLCSEDRRFFYHPGVDVFAVARAGWTNLRAGRVLSGGSTITQQLVRNLRPREGSGLGEKLAEAYWAVRLECHYTKRQLLEAYLNRIAYGNQSYGIEAASRLYFDKPASKLSVAQGAFLAVLPRSPSELNPYLPSVRREIVDLSHRLLREMHSRGRIDAETLQVALTEEPVLAPVTSAFEASHFCDLVLERLPRDTPPAVRTTLDLEIQTAVDGLLATHLKSLAGHQVSNGAVIVMDVETGDLLALAGSEDYFGEEGQFNAALSPRQPGSTLKPFTYSLALEQGSSPATILPDIDLYPSDGESFIPQNYDSRFHGPVRLRTALACSYNVPAVRALEQVGIDSLLLRMRALGAEHLKEDPEHYGLGLTLGDGEMSLLELVRAYRALARHGLYAPERLLLEQPLPEDREVIDPRSAYLITHILSDKDARIPAFGASSALNLPFPCAAKTGTSKGYRDNWTIGYTSRYVVGVWVGNFDGRPMVGVSGVTGAGPLFRDVMMTLQPEGGLPFERPAGLEERPVCPTFGEVPGPHCPNTVLDLFTEESEFGPACSVHRLHEGRLYAVYPPLYRAWMLENGMELPATTSQRVGEAVEIVFPYSGAVFQLDPVLRADYQKIHMKATVPSGVEPITWWVDGRRAGQTREPVFVWKMRRGRHQVAVEAGGRQSALIEFTVR